MIVITRRRVKSKLFMGDPIIQCDVCNAELTVNPSDLVTVVEAWYKGTGEGVTVKQVADICMMVYGSNVERALFLMLKRGELEITGMEKGQPLLRMAKKDAKPPEVEQPRTGARVHQEDVDAMQAGDGMISGTGVSVEVSQPVTSPKSTPKPTPEPTPKPTPKPTLVPKKKLTRKRYDWKLGERLWNDGKTKEEIALTLGCAVITVKKRARGRWKRREKQTPKKVVRKRKPEPESVPSKLEGQSVGKKATIRREKRDYVLCPSCLKNTTSFPCELCGSTDPKLHARMLAPVS